MDLAIYLDSSASKPIYHQLTEQLRTAMLQGTLQPDQRLPSSRTLAQQLQVVLN